MSPEPTTEAHAPQVEEEFASPEKASLANHIFQAEIGRVLLLEVVIFNVLERTGLLDAKTLADFVKDALRGRVSDQFVQKAHSFALKREWLNTIDDMIFCRSVELVEKYMKDILCEIYRFEPKSLIGTGSIDFLRVLDAPDKNAVINNYISEHAERVSYQGYDGLMKAFAKLGLNNLATQEEETKFQQAAALRNEIVHKNFMSTNIKDTFFSQYQKRVESIFWVSD